MDIIFYLNSVLLFFTIVYAIAFGIRNLIVNFIGLFVGGANQSSLGKFLDAMFVTSILYFSTFGLSYIQSILEYI